MPQWHNGPPVASSWPAWPALFLAGCVERDAPGVGIQKLAADIVFGVKPAGRHAAAQPHPGQAGQGDATTYVPDGFVRGPVAVRRKATSPPAPAGAAPACRG